MNFSNTSNKSNLNFNDTAGRFAMYDQDFEALAKKNKIDISTENITDEKKTITAKISCINIRLRHPTTGYQINIK